MTYTSRELAPSDATALADFTCSVRPRGFELAVQESIRYHLAGQIGHGDLEALGAWSGEDLVGVVAWQQHPELPRACFVNVVAVASGHRHRGLGTWLKRTVMERAREDGISVVVSVVHVDNHAMEKVNMALGGTPQPIPGDWSHRYWLVPIR